MPHLAPALACLTSLCSVDLTHTNLGFEHERQAQLEACVPASVRAALVWRTAQERGDMARFERMLARKRRSREAPVLGVAVGEQ